MRTEDFCKGYLEAILKADKSGCYKVIDEAFKAQVPVIDIYQGIFFPVMVRIGELWQINKISVAQEHLFTAITQNIISSFYSKILESIRYGDEVRGNVIVVCPGNELHELGARMLSDLWELEGWNVTYLGSNIPSDFIIETLCGAEYTALGLSCSLSFNVRYVKETVEKARSAGFSGAVIVGGRMFNIEPNLKNIVGADFHGRDFYEAIKIINNIGE